MNRSERFFIVGGVAASLALAGAAYLHQGAGGAAFARQGAGGGEVALRVGTVDTFTVTDALLKIDPYAKMLTVESTKVTDVLTPMDKELKQFEDELKALGPAVQEPANREKVQTFRMKRDAFNQKRAELNRSYESAISRINYEAFQAAVQATRDTANAKGYTIVFSSRAHDATRVPEDTLAFTLGSLSRPVVVSPEGDDLTLAVLAWLKLPDPRKETVAPVNPNAGAAPAVGTPGGTPPAPVQAPPAGKP